MPTFDVTPKRVRINIFKIGGAYYFKHFFNDPGLFEELQPYYEKARYGFRMNTAAERNKVMKLLDNNGYDPTVIEDATPYMVEVNRYEKYGDLLRNTVDNYPKGDRMILIMKDEASVEQALMNGAKKIK
jgi:hypothetical protein